MTATFTAKISFANYLTRELETLSFTGTKAQAEQWLGIKVFQAAGNEVSTSLVENTLAQVLADLKVEHADADRNRIRRPGFHHSQYTGAPLPVV